MAKIGFIGTGIMGRPMAQNLQKAGHSLFLSTPVSYTHLTLPTNSRV